MPLSEAMLREAAGERTFTRGEEYVRYVHGLRITATHAYASVQAKRAYTVELDFSGSSLDGWCTCLHRADENFCKHLVAVGLAAIDSGRIADLAGDGALRAAVTAMDVDELRELVVTMAQRDDGLRSRLTAHAAAASGDLRAAQTALKTLMTEALSIRGYLDYRQTFDFASGVSAVLDDFEDHVNSGAADLVRPALREAVTELREIVQHVDDSDGVIGDECQRAADLYAAACRQGVPDPVELAEWLVRFRDESPGWPNVVLADFVEAFDDEALEAYRRSVAELDASYAERGHRDHYEVDRMLLELADHDGDVDRAVQLLVREGSTAYGSIVDRLRAVGRDDDALTWLDRGVTEGKVTLGDRHNAYWLNVDDVVATYQNIGRTDDAVDVLRSLFAEQPRVSSYRALLDFASSVNRVDSEREWAFAQARQHAARFSNGAVLVQLALADGDAEQAWAFADEFGAGSAWQELALRGGDARPIDAADLYRPGLEQDLLRPDTRLYDGIASRLLTMSRLYEKGGRSADFAPYLAQIRADYRRRPSLMKALDAQGL